MSFRHLAICLLLVVLPFSRSRLVADELPMWTSIGPDGGNVQVLAVSPALPGWILAGLPQGYGIFRSADRGKSWGAATDALGRNVLDLAISANGRAFYAATDRGLLKSTDGGALWPALDASEEAYTLVAAHPRKAAIVFAVRGGVLLRSADGGVTRDAVQGPQGVAKIAFALVGQRTVVYAGAGNGLWRSTDDGRTWKDASPPFPSSPRVDAVAIDPGDPRVLYVSVRHEKRVLFKSLDGGATWRLSQRGLAAAGGALPAVSEIAVDRTNRSIVYAVAGGALFRSVNGGRDWSRPASQPPGGFVNALEATGYGVLAATPAGVLLSIDKGLTWQPRVAGLAATSIVSMAIDHQEPARLYATDVSLGIFKTANQGRPWLRVADHTSLPLSSQPLAIDPVDPNIVYAGTATKVLKSTDGGRRWVAFGVFNYCATLTQLAIDPHEPATLFISGHLVPPCLDPYICTFLRSLDAGETWQCIGDPIYRHSFLAVDPLTSAVYARATFGLVRSTDDGETWTPLGYDGVWAASVTSFAASPLVEGTLWAGDGGTVMRSLDDGQTWEPFSTGLPSGEYVADLVPDPADPATLYAATLRSGVFKSTDSGETWSLAGVWPPGVRFRGDLLIDPNDPAILYAGTEGLGVLCLDQSGS